MSHYSDDPQRVRVDIFKPGGKWYTTIEVKWLRYRSGNDESIHDIFRESLRKECNSSNAYQGMTAVCLNPYHEHAHPLMIKDL